MTQYEWVDVYSLKRWGDPSTMGSIGGGSTWNPSSGQGFQWNQETDFTKEGLFCYYRDTPDSDEYYSDIVSNELNFSLSIYESWFAADRNKTYSSSFYTDFLLCNEFDKFSSMTENTLKYIQGTFTTSYQRWALYIVLEDGTILGTDIYQQAVSGIALRLPIKKMKTVDTRFLGKFMMYPFRFDFVSDYNRDGTDIHDIINTPTAILGSNIGYKREPWSSNAYPNTTRHSKSFGLTFKVSGLKFIK